MILGNSDYAKMIDWDDIEGIKDFILSIYQKYINGDKLLINYPQKETYSRENLAKKFHTILENYKKQINNHSNI
jgi:ribosome recycling factor